MTKLIRCIEGHVYDADQNSACPECGAIPGIDDSGRSISESSDEKQSAAPAEAKTSVKEKAHSLLAKAKAPAGGVGALFGIPKVWLVAGVAGLLVLVAVVASLSPGEGPKSSAQNEASESDPSKDADKGKNGETGKDSVADEKGDDQADAAADKEQADDGPDAKEDAKKYGAKDVADNTDEKAKQAGPSEQAGNDPADGSQAKKDDKFSALRTRAARHFENNDFDSAIADFTDIIRQGGAIWQDYNMRGMSYHSKKQLDLAMADYERALKIPDHREYVHYNRMLIFANRGETDAALAEMNAAIDDHKSTDPSHFMARGDLYMKKAAYDNAIADYDKAIDYLGKDKNALDSNKALLFYLRGEAKRKKALSDLEACRKADPKKASEGNCGYRTSLLIPLLDFEAAAALNADDAATHYQIGWIAMELGNYDRAIDSFSKAIRIDPAYSWAYSDRCLAYGLKKQLDLALGDCNDAIRYDDKNYNAWANRGVIYRLKGGRANRKKSIADLRQALKIRPDYEYAATLLRKIGVKP